ncbi:MAG: hypothetical protein SNG14_03835 [Rikenellaceae bacterium]
MEIDQYLYDLNEAGEAIVAYRMSAPDGGSVEVCNLGAAVLSWSVGGEDLGSGVAVRGLRGLQGSGLDNFGGVKFSELLWESRVEVNRVVMSLSFESDGVGIMCEVIFDYDDDNTLEITYIYCTDADYEFDLTHNLTLAIDSGEGLQMVEGHKKPILGYVGKSGKIEIYSSQPATYTTTGKTAMVDNAPFREADVRYVAKSLFRIVDRPSAE